MDDQPTQEEIEAIGDALAAGRKIEAIKIYRDATGKGLKEAKEFIEALIPKLQEHDPEKYAKLAKSGGCTSMLLLGVTLGCVSIIWILK